MRKRKKRNCPRINRIKMKNHRKEERKHEKKKKRNTQESTEKR